MRFYPASTLASLRGAILLDTTMVWSGAPGRLDLPKAAGNCLDIEINITFPGGVVPADFGSVGVSVLGSPTCDASPPAPSPRPPSPAPRESAAFDQTQHGPHVSVTIRANGSEASWGATQGGNLACNEVAFIDGTNVSSLDVLGSSSLLLLSLSSSQQQQQSYWVRLGTVGEWQDIGWCSRSVDATGATWVGPNPKYLGFQGTNKAWLYRNNLGQKTGLYKASSAPSDESQGIPYGASYTSGANVTAIRALPSAGHPFGHLEFLVDGVSQGVVTLDEAMPDDVVGCVATCGGGDITTGVATPSPPPTPPAPPPCANTEVTVSSTGGGAFALNRVPLAPSQSARPRPTVLTLRVLVDRSVVEAFAQGGRATWASMTFPAIGQNRTALVWSLPTRTADGGGGSAQNGGSGVDTPTFSIRVWEMQTGYA
jgi:hypothetical protein